MLSWVAMDRIVEKQRAGDATYRQRSERKVLRSDAQPLSDDDLLAKLRSLGIELDRSSLNGFASRHSRPRRLPHRGWRSAIGQRRWKATGSGFA